MHNRNSTAAKAACRQALTRRLFSICALLLAAGLRAADPDVPTDHLRITTDGNNYQPSVGVDSDGNTHVTWLSGDHKVRYRKLDEKGDVVPTAFQQLDGIAGGYGPKIAVDQLGNAHIVCGLSSGNGLVYIRVAASGVKTVQSSVAFNSTSATYVAHWAPSIAIDPANSDLPVVAAIVQATYPTGMGTQVYVPLFGWIPIGGGMPDMYYELVTAFRLDASGHITSRETLSSESSLAGYPYRSDYPSVAVDSAGRIHCAWVFQNTDAAVGDGRTYVGYRNSDEISQVGDSIMLVSAPDGVSRRGPRMVCDSQDRLHVVWPNPLGTGSVWYSQISRDGIHETTGPLTSAEARPSGAPTVAVDDSLVHVVWPDSRDGNTEIYYTALRADTALSPLDDGEGPPEAYTEDRLTTNTAGSLNPAVGVNSQGVRGIAWQDNRYNGDYEILLLQETKPSWTWLLYINGDNDLCDTYLHDLNRLEVEASNRSVQVVVQFDGDGNGDTRCFRLRYDSDLNETLAQMEMRYQSQGDDMWSVGPGGEADMGAPETLTDFIVWGTQNFPAPHTMLSIVDHGNGWLPQFAQEQADVSRAISIDENGTHDPGDSGNDTSLSLKELCSALDAAGGPLDVLFLDACLMGMIETAYELRDCADYLVFSQAVSYTNPYSAYLRPVDAATKPLEMAKVIATEYHRAMVSSGNSHTISALNCAKMEVLADQVFALTQAIMPTPDQPPDPNGPDLKTACFAAWVKAQKVDDDGRYTDLHDWCAKLQAALIGMSGTSAISQQAQAVMDLVEPGDDRLVVKEYHDEVKNRYCHGLSIYFPFTRLDLGIEGVPEEEEETVGGFIALSGGSGSRASSAEKMIHAVIRYDETAKRGAVVLAGGGGKIKVWALDDNDQPTEAILDDKTATRTWDLESEPDRDHLNRVKNRLMVEGCEIGRTQFVLFQRNPDAPDGWGAGDQAEITVFSVELVSPVDSDGDGKVNDFATEDNGRTGNVFGYDRSTPAVCSIPVLLRIEPDTPALRQLFANKVTGRLEPVAGGGYASALTWDSAATTDASVGNLVYDARSRLWKGTAAFTGLPAVPGGSWGRVPAGLRSLLYGKRSAIITVGSPTGAEALEVKTEPYEVYFGDSLEIDEKKMAETTESFASYIQVLVGGDGLTGIRREIYEKMNCSTETFSFATMDQARENFAMRKLAIELISSTPSGFDLDYCDAEQWSSPPPQIGATVWEPLTQAWDIGLHWEPWEAKPGFYFRQRNVQTAFDAVQHVEPFRGECLGAIQLVYQRAAAEAVGAGEFNRIHSSPLLVGNRGISMLPHLFLVFGADPYDDYNHNGVYDHKSLFDNNSDMEDIIDTLGNPGYDGHWVLQGKDDRTMVPGDYCYFKNRDNYLWFDDEGISYGHPGGASSGENCVYVGFDERTESARFSGLGLLDMTENGLRAEMRRAYNYGLSVTADVFSKADDLNGNGRWDAGEPVAIDYNQNGWWDPGQMTTQDAEVSCRFTHLWRIVTGTEGKVPSRSEAPPVLAEIQLTFLDPRPAITPVHLRASGFQTRFEGMLTKYACPEMRLGRLCEVMGVAFPAPFRAQQPTAPGARDQLPEVYELTVGEWSCTFVHPVTYDSDGRCRVGSPYRDIDVVVVNPTFRRLH